MRIVAGTWRGRALVAPPGQGTRPTADRVRQALFDMLMHAEWGGRAVIEGAVVLDVFAGTGALGLEALSRGAASACFIEQDAAALRALRANVAACKAEGRAEILAVDVLSTLGASSLRYGEAKRSNNALNSPAWSGHLSNAPHGPTWAGHLSNARHAACPGHRTGQGAGTGGRDRSGHDDGGGGSMTARASLVFLDPPYGQNLVSRALNRLSEGGCIAPGALIVAEVGRDERWLPDHKLLAERQHGAARVLIFRAV